MKATIIFDGECNFCNHYINTLISMDKKRHFQFTPYESNLAATLLQKHGLTADFKESFILSYGNQHYIKSEAVVNILKKLGGFWGVLAWLLQFLVPKKVKDAVYDLIAKNRYRISKRYNSCQIPTPEMLSRFKE